MPVKMLDILNIFKWKCGRTPTIRKCCFCVPIRRGVTIFGYVYLVLSLISLPLLIFLLVDEAMSETKADDDHLNPLVHLPITIAFVIIDVIMAIVLLIGAHQKKTILLKIYLYFGLVFQLMTLCLDLIYFDFRDHIENGVYFFFLVCNIYLLFLVYNTVRLLEEPTEVQYIIYRDTSRQSV